MQITQTSLTMIGLNTNEPQVFWNGAKVEGIVGIAVANDAETQRVILKISEDPLLAEMQAAGITIRRVVA
jgi:hypothetical protein